MKRSGVGSEGAFRFFGTHADKGIQFRAIDISIGIVYTMPIRKGV